MECDLLIRDTVRTSDARRPSVVVIKLPGGDGTIIAHATLDIDHTRRSKVCPGEFFLASPYQLDWLPRGLREAGRFKSGITSMLTAIGGAGIRNHDPHSRHQFERLPPVP